MVTIEEFIQRNVGRPNMTPKGLVMEAYAMGIAHGKGEEYEQEPEEEVLEESVQEEEENEVEEDPTQHLLGASEEEAGNVWDEKKRKKTH